MRSSSVVLVLLAATGSAVSAPIASRDMSTYPPSGTPLVSPSANDGDESAADEINLDVLGLPLFSLHTTRATTDSSTLAKRRQEPDESLGSLARRFQFHGITDTGDTADTADTAAKPNAEAVAPEHPAAVPHVQSTLETAGKAEAELAKGAEGAKGGNMRKFAAAGAAGVAVSLIAQHMHTKQQEEAQEEAQRQAAYQAAQENAYRQGQAQVGQVTAREDLQLDNRAFNSDELVERIARSPDSEARSNNDDRKFAQLIARAFRLNPAEWSTSAKIVGAGLGGLAVGNWVTDYARGSQPDGPPPNMYNGQYSNSADLSARFFDRETRSINDLD